MLQFSEISSLPPTAIGKWFPRWLSVTVTLLDLEKAYNAHQSIVQDFVIPFESSEVFEAPAINFGCMID